jgi:hypothetical protein
MLFQYQTGNLTHDSHYVLIRANCSTETPLLLDYVEARTHITVMSATGIVVPQPTQTSTATSTETLSVILLIPVSLPQSGLSLTQNIGHSISDTQCSDCGWCPGQPGLDCCGRDVCLLFTSSPLPTDALHLRWRRRHRWRRPTCASGGGHATAGLPTDLRAWLRGDASSCKRPWTTAESFGRAPFRAPPVLRRETTARSLTSTSGDVRNSASSCRYRRACDCTAPSAPSARDGSVAARLEGTVAGGRPQEKFEVRSIQLALWFVTEMMSRLDGRGFKFIYNIVKASKVASVYLYGLVRRAIICLLLSLCQSGHSFLSLSARDIQLPAVAMRNDAYILHTTTPTHAGREEPQACAPLPFLPPHPSHSCTPIAQSRAC